MFATPKALLLACAVLVACDDAPAGRPSAASDALWKLAPEGARGAIVASPYGVAMFEKAVDTLRAFIAKAGIELSTFDKQLDLLLEDMGGKGIKLADLGLTPTKGFARFFTKDGTVDVLPIADRAAFVAKLKGTAAATPDGVDKVNGNACKTFGPHYVCAPTEALLATVGKSNLKDRLLTVKARGDLEIVATELPLEGPSMPRSSIAAAVVLERGSWVVRGTLGNPPADLVSKIQTQGKPRTAIGGSSGFAVFDVRTILEATDDKVVTGVTQADIVKSIAGPLTLDVPAGSPVLDMQLPLTTPAPFQKVVEQCGEVPALAGVATFANGVCQLKLAQLELDLEMWVDGNVLHIGKKVPPAKAKVAMSPVATELATGNWGLAFWGRGTLFSPSGRPSTETPADPGMAMMRALSTIDEIGFGVKTDGEKQLRFLLTMRTAFADPQPVVDQITSISIVDVASGKAATKAKAIADAHPRSHFAQDLAAGQHGLVVPTQMLGTSLSLIVPALMHYTRGDQPKPAEAPPIQPGGVTKLRVEGYATHGYQMWKEKNPGKVCPVTMMELAAAVSPEAVDDDEWGKKLEMKCGKDLPAGAKDISIRSLGFDGKPDTADDIKSY
ncbi:MAG: hypothetical protein H0V17_25100 [Deltaproteobacteria bacterium]|nr:hypothetical protein [Deltaproteobacteria bacterium]